MFGFSKEETWQSPMEIIRHCFYGQEMSCVCVCVRTQANYSLFSENLCTEASAAECTSRFKAARTPSTLNTWAQAYA